MRESPVHGVVTAFDGDAGLGEVAADDGTTLAFHCVEIADGSRSVAVGTAVRFVTIPKLGGIEAAHLETRGGSVVVSGAAPPLAALAPIVARLPGGRSADDD